MTKHQYFINKAVISWYDQNKRILPWRIRSPGKLQDPYKVLISEFMLQQTTVATVTRRYREFINLWPSLKDLCRASEKQILKFWSGLGYYNRALNLLKCAKIIKKKHNSQIPTNKKDLLNLPGIGEYTASAILGIAFNKPIMAIDTNVERIIVRIYGIKSPISDIKEKIKILSQNFVYKSRPADMIQSLMDFGAVVCKARNPVCKTCCIRNKCQAYKKQLTHVIPFKKQNKATASVNKYAFFYLIVKDNHKILLRRRKAGGMMPLMLEVPTSQWSKKPLSNDNFMNYKPIKIKFQTTELQFAYNLSNFKLNIKIFIGFTNRKSVKGFRWYNLNKINSLEMPTIMKKVVTTYIKSVG